MTHVRAGGCIFISIKTKRIMLGLRSSSVSNPHIWSFVGGKIEDGETILQGVSRELREEIGFIPTYQSVLPIDIFRSTDGKFTYHSFAVIVGKEFMPRLNHENSGYGWFKVDGLPKPLHSGAKLTLMHKDFKRIFKEIINDHK